ncbi:hypothetical protein BH18ACT15_BH18ACT15_11540 [soil metagenome]
MTKKNRKARRLMTLYPGVRCKILYQRDYLSLLRKYGLDEGSPQEESASPAPGREGPAGLGLAAG